MDEVKPVARVPTAEHREPCESRGSRTVLGAPGGEIPPGDSTITSISAHCRHVRWSPNGDQKLDMRIRRAVPNADKSQDPAHQRAAIATEALLRRPDQPINVSAKTPSGISAPDG